MKDKPIPMLWLALTAGLLVSGAPAADPEIPNLVGTWIVEAEGGVLTRDTKPRENIHHRGEFSTLKGEAVIDQQQGRIFHGTFTSPRDRESFIGGITMDNKRIIFADEDGMLEGEIRSADRIEVTYRHVTPTDTVIGVGTFTRKP